MDGEAGGVEGGLHVHSVVHDIGNELRVCDWLIRSSHNAKAYVLIPFFHERRNDGVKRALARREYVGRCWIEGEESTTILKNESHAADSDARAEQGVVALNEGDDVAIAIDGGQVGGIAGRRVSVHHVAVGFGGIDEFRALTRVIF